jgi:hypothetical protein
VIVGKIFFFFFERVSRRTYDGLTLKLEKCLDIVKSYLPFPVVARCKALVCGRSPGEIPPGIWKSACCECCVLSGRGLCDELIAHPEESYGMWCVVVCDPETS